MFDWLFEGGLWFYVMLAIPAVVLLALWVRDRKAGWLYGLSVVAVLALTVFLLDFAVETRNEQIRRKLTEMAAAVRTRDVDTIFRHISPRFRLGAKDKAGFRRSVEGVINRVDTLQIWDVKFTDNGGRVSFSAKPSGSLPGSDAFYLIRGEFVQDDDKQWRMQSFEAFNPYSDTKTPLDVARYLP